MPHHTKADKAALESITRSRQRKEAALARKHELDLAQREGSLLPAERVRAVWAEHLARVRDRFLSLPDRLRDDLANQPAEVVGLKLYEAIEGELHATIDTIPN